MNAPFLRRNKVEHNSRPKKRVGELAVLPVFFNLSGKSVVLVGGTDAAAWKAELLAAAGAQIYVHAATLCETFRALAKTIPDQLVMRAPSQLAADISNATMVICDAKNTTAAKRMQTIARLLGVPLNVIDRPNFCDFQFGSIVNRSPAIVAISTTGAAPILGQAIRRRIEMILPEQISQWAELARCFRDEVNTLLQSGYARRAFWEKFVDSAFSEQVSVNSEKELLDRCRDNAKIQIPKTKTTLAGYIVSDPELVTIKAIRALQSADVIVHSPITPAEVIALGRREAKRVCVDNPSQADTPQGTHTVKLVEGNPSLFDHTEF